MHFSGAVWAPEKCQKARWVGELLDRWRSARQRIANHHIHRIVVRSLGPAGGHIPRHAIHILILSHQVESAVLGVLPEGLVEAEGHFVDGAVLAVGRSRVAIADASRPV